LFRIYNFFLKKAKKKPTVTMSHSNNSSGGSPEPPDHDSKTASTENASVERFKSLVTFFNDWVIWLEILKEYDPEEYNSVNLNADNAKITKLAVELSILNIFYQKIQSRKIKLSDQYLFFLVIPWLFHLQIGSYFEYILSHHLFETNAKKNFQILFLSYQEANRIFFSKDRPINDAMLLPTQIYFNKTNLSRVIRLIVASYQPGFWEETLPREKFLFTNKLINLTWTEGSYRYINALFDDENFSFCQESKKVQILNQTFSL
jgi:hypothetical protein